MQLRKLVFKKDPWENVKTKYSPAVVAIEMIYPRPFSHNHANYGLATGFIVDKERGIILTNRHVVSDGPIRAKGRFFKNEELDLIPMYRDPVHDFAFFYFEPCKLEQTNIIEIELFPEGGTSGEKVLVMGNNAGEKLTYIESTLAQSKKTIDHPMCYNTFFISATDLTSGGSSGGPVLNQNGDAVAMVCCGMFDTNSSYYLPLFRALRVLKLLRFGISPELITRGTLQISFAFYTFEEVFRLGVPEEEIETLRRNELLKDIEGMLVVNRILRKGTGYKGGLRNGDILHKLNGNIILNYVDLEHVLDSAVDEKVEVSIFRHNVKFVLQCRVQNLREITPREYIEVSDSISHSLEYTLALQNNIEVEGVYLNKLGYMFKELRNRVNKYGPVIILKLGKFLTPDLDSFQRALEHYPNGYQVSIIYFNIFDKHKENYSKIVIDKRWYSFVRAKRVSYVIKNLKTSETDVEFNELLGEEFNSLKEVIENNQQLDRRTYQKYAQKIMQIEKAQKQRENETMNGLNGASIGRKSTQRHHRSSSKTQSFSEMNLPSEASVSRPIFGDKWEYQDVAKTQRPFAESTTQLMKVSGGLEQLGMRKQSRERKAEALDSSPLDCLAYVEYKTPFPLDSKTTTSSKGIGLVVDSELGLIVCERVTIPSTLGDFFVTFNAAKTVTAKVLFVHPFSEFSIIQYDTNEVEEDALCGEISSLQLSEEDIEIGMKLNYYGLTTMQERLVRVCRVNKLQALVLNPNAAAPFFVGKNIDCFCTDMDNRETGSIGGIFVDQSSNKVIGFHHYFSKVKFKGLKAVDVRPYVEQVRRVITEAEPLPRTIKLLPVQIAKMPLVQARSTLNLNDEWALKLLKTMGPFSRSLLTVSRLMQASDISKKLKENDLILAIDDDPVTQFTQVAKFCNRAIKDYASRGLAALAAQVESAPTDVPNKPVIDEKPVESETSSLPSRTKSDGGVMRKGSIAWNLNDKIRSLGRIRSKPRRPPGIVDGKLQASLPRRAGRHSIDSPTLSKSSITSRSHTLDRLEKPVTVKLTILRDRKILNLNEVQLAEVTCVGTERVLIFAGMILQRIHEEIKFLGLSGSELPSDENLDLTSGVYITSICKGSPADAEAQFSDAKRSNCLITRVNGSKVNTLDDMIWLVHDIEHSEYVNFTSMDVATGRRSVYSVRLDLEYWKTRELRRDSIGNWTETSLNVKDFSSFENARKQKTEKTFVEVVIEKEAAPAKDKAKKPKAGKPQRNQKVKEKGPSPKEMNRKAKRTRQKEKEKEKERERDEEKDVLGELGALELNLPASPSMKKVASNTEQTGREINASTEEQQQPQQSSTKTTTTAKRINETLKHTYRKTKLFFSP